MRSEILLRVEVFPYKTFKERIRITKDLEKLKGKIEITDKAVIFHRLEEADYDS